MYYCIQACHPHLQKDIDVEKVQRRATKLINECKGLEYEQRLKVTKLTTLETRRRRADLSEVFKIIKGMEGLNEEIFFTRVQAQSNNTSTTRGHMFKLYKKRFRLDIAKYSFGNRIVSDWNALPDRVIEAEDLGAFKGRFDHYLNHTRGLV